MSFESCFTILKQTLHDRYLHLSVLYKQVTNDTNLVNELDRMTELYQQNKIWCITTNLWYLNAMATNITTKLDNHFI